MKDQQGQKHIYVYADWISLGGPKLLGILNVSITRGKEVFYFEYDADWLRSAPAQVLDPDLMLYSGPQYLSESKSNFGLFLDSSPDRWGRLLMKKREAVKARKEGRSAKTLYESDDLIDSISSAVRRWRSIATSIGISKSEQDLMSSAFKIVEN